MKRRRKSEFKLFYFTRCPYCGGPYQQDDIIFRVLAEMRVCRLLVQCRDCGTIYCVQRSRNAGLTV